MADDGNVKRIISYYESLADMRGHFENHWQEVSENSLGRSDFTRAREPGTQRKVRIYDSTASDANELLSSALHSLLTNPATNWIDIRWQNEALEDIDEAVYYLESVRNRVRTAFSRPDSAFATQIHEVYGDWTGFGTACMFVQDDPGFGARFMARPLSEIYIDVDETKVVAAVFRAFELKAWQAVDTFGAENVPRAAEVVEKHPNKPFRFLHHVRRNSAPLPGRFDASGMPWESIYIDLESKEIIDVGGYFEMPYMVPRWRVESGEMYGRCPGIDTLPNQKMLNAIWKTYIRQGEKAADPPVLVDDESVMPGSTVKTTPSAQIVIRNDGGAREPVRYLESRAQFAAQVDIIENRSNKIEKAFHSEIIAAFRDPRMTATQVLELARLAQRQLSPIMGRGQVELLHPMIVRVYGIESRRFDFPVAPVELEGQEMKIEYVTPVARAQKQGEAQAILDSFASVLAFAEAAPDAIDNIDTDQAVRSIFEGNGVPIQILRRPDEVAVRRTARAQQAQEEKNQQDMIEGAGAVAGLLPGIAKLTEQPGGAAPSAAA